MTLTFAGSAIARKPAVEAVVGVEPQSYKTTSVGTEVMFNFGNFIKGNTPTAVNTNNPSNTPAWLATSTLFAFITLPFLMWFAISRSVKGVEVVEEEQTTDNNVTSHDNVANLSDYKSTTSDKDKKDGGKKAA
jgi:hypothetical protein